MAVTLETIDFDTVTFKVFYLCVTLLLLKMSFMAPLIFLQRILKKVVISPEDKFLKNLKVKHNDPDVERPRRSFLNDLENILIFVSVASFYAMMKPSPLVAIPLFLIYTLARYCHTFVYAVVVLRQPSRFLSYAVGYVITAYIAGYVAYYARDAM